MTCEEYIIKRLERAEDDARNIRDSYEKSCKRIRVLEDQLIKIADNFRYEEKDESKYVTSKKCLYFENSEDKEFYQIIKSWMQLDMEDLPF